MRDLRCETRLAVAVTPPPRISTKDEAMSRSISPRRTVALAAVIALLAPASVAFADPDTNIQKPGHVSISRPLGDA
jgi:hypothetical protein